VVFFEPRSLWATSEEVPAVDATVPIGQARLARRGADMTLVTWSTTLPASLAAANRAGSEGISVEVVDLRTLWPWDTEAVLDSVRRTGRLLVAHEAVRVGGLGAEICAVVAERLGGTLKSPVARVGAPRIPVPYSPPLENAYRVTEEKLIQEIRRVTTNEDAE
jgi:pyruvate dehydrogenase E1 component beta subunit